MIGFQRDGIEFRFFNHLHAVSMCGKVLRKMAPCEPCLRKDGYMAMGRFLLHRAVATCWLEKPHGAKHVHHKNGDKTDNRAENLEWLTPMEHARRHDDERRPYQRTPESIAKFIASRTGVKDSEASRIRKRARLLTIVPKTTCKYQGVTFPSIAAAARHVGISPATFRLRCLSKNFPEYEILALYYGS